WVWPWCSATSSARPGRRGNDASPGWSWPACTWAWWWRTSSGCGRFSRRCRSASNTGTTSCGYPAGGDGRSGRLVEQAFLVVEVGFGLAVVAHALESPREPLVDGAEEHPQRVDQA